MIKTIFSKRHKCKVYRLDAKVNGKRFRRFFFKKSEAEAVAYKIKHDEVARRYGLPVLAERPFLSDLIEKRLALIQTASESTRARRVLHDLLALLPTGYCVDELTKSDIQKYVDKRRLTLKPQSINRELHIVNSMLTTIDVHYPQLEQWRAPKMPMQKELTGRRERLWEPNEIDAVLGGLFARKRDDEQISAALARYRVGQRLRLLLLSGLRHGEMAKIRKADINWQSKTVRVKQGKGGGRFKTVGPLHAGAMSILKEFADSSNTEFVMYRGGKVNKRVYRIMADACKRAGIPYGQNTPNGLTFHDARHTATTHLLESGISPKTVQEWMGWADSSFVLYYSVASKKSREKAGRALEKLAGKKTA